ncbi:fumarylacetoacetate hydrolase family protein [Dyella sp. C9]|uniref:fumarylacetoacetate hydrolase family protein n=1 Tax=Dyella sp. C9 TaxID=2202154 RepID=UPI000DEF562F|nr:fumarylacetoacetate hydrolase family protein [Dyella sp. C9]
MKLATYLHQGAPRIGIVHAEDSQMFDLAAAAERAGTPSAAFASMLDLIDGDTAALDLAHSVFARRRDEQDLSQDLAAVKLLSPVPVPRQMRGFTNFDGHLRHAPVGVQRLLARLKGLPPPNLPEHADVPAINRQRPIYFKTNRYSVIGTDTDIRWPSFAHYMDYELECGFFLVRRGVNIKPERAHEHIFGYTIFNDISARDEQVVEMQGHLGPAKGKDFDTGNVIGPWIVTRDELPDIRSRRMTARVNGELRTDTTMEDGVFTFEEMIAFVSRDETLHAGEFISAGTVTGGSGLERDSYLSDGDLFEFSIDGIGTLRNRLVKPVDD